MKKILIPVFVILLAGFVAYKLLASSNVPPNVEVENTEELASTTAEITETPNIAVSVKPAATSTAPANLPPTLTLSVSPTTIDSKKSETATLTWATTNVTSCNFNGYNVDGKLVGVGSASVAPGPQTSPLAPKATTRFVMTCTNKTNGMVATGTVTLMVK